MSEYKPLTCLPVLPLRGIVVFPGCVTHFDVGRSKSARAVEEAMRGDQMIFLVAQRDVQCDEPKRPICTRSAPSPMSARSCGCRATICAFWSRANTAPS